MTSFGYNILGFGAGGSKVVPLLNILVVAGGGGGAGGNGTGTYGYQYSGGGGGAGGYRTGADLEKSAGNYRHHFIWRRWRWRWRGFWS